MAKKAKPDKYEVPDGAVVLTEELEHFMRNNANKANTVKSFIVDRELERPRGYLIGQLRRQLLVGGVVYVTRNVVDDIDDLMKIYFTEKEEEGDFTAYGNTKKPASKKEEPAIEEPDEEEEVEDSPSESWGVV